MSWRWLEVVFPVYALNKYLWDKLNPHKPQEPGRPPQTSCYGTPLTLAYGKTRITGNLIYLEDVAKEQVRVQLALCEGPIAGIGLMWLNGSAQDFTSTALILAIGTRPTQSAFINLPAAKALGYPGTAVIGPLWTWKTSNVSVGQMSFEVKALLHNTGGSAGDANPADILSGSSSMLTNWDYGARFPYEVVTDVGRDGSAASSFRRYVEQEGLWLSPAFTDQRPAREQLDSVLASTNSTCLWTGGKLEIVPLGDTDSGTYTAPSTAQYAFEPGDFLAKDGKRLELEVPPETDSYNIHPIEFLERAPAASSADPSHAYNVATVDDPDPVDVATRGERRAPIEQMHHVCLRDVALKISRIRAQMSVRSRTTYKFRLPWRYARLEALDIVSVTDPLLGWLEPVTLRIQRIRETRARELDIEAMEWPMGMGYAIAHDTQSSDSPFATLPDLNQLWIDAERRAFCRFKAGTFTGGVGTAVRDPLTGNMIAVYDDIMQWSADGGATWTAATSPPVGGWYHICASSTKVLAVSFEGKWALSTDSGVTWSDGSLPASGSNYTGVASDGSAFVAVGPSKAVYSATGDSWTSALSFPACEDARVIWTGGSYCALLSQADSTKDQITRSLDGGQTWSTPVELAATTSTYSHSKWLLAGNGVVLAIGLNATSRSKDDGVTWATTDAVVQYTGLFTGRQFLVMEYTDVSTPLKFRASIDGLTWDDIDTVTRFTPVLGVQTMVYDGHQLALLQTDGVQVSNPVAV